MKTLTRARATRAVFCPSIPFLVLLASTIFSVFALARDTPLTCQQEWRQQHEAKSKLLRPYQPGSLEAGTVYVQKEKRLERLTEGWKGLHPKLGGLSTGSGFAGACAMRSRLQRAA